MREPVGGETALRDFAADTARPRLPSGLVRRPRLLEAIDAGVRGTATVISAGAGWGKTTLAASWASARSASGPIAWLTLDDEHNDADELWAALSAAMATAGVVLPPSPPAVDDLGRPRLGGLRAGSLKTTVVVVLDDVHKLVDRRVLRWLGGFLSGAPERLRFLLSGRHTGGLPLHQLRIAGGLTELGAVDLGFRVNEATELLTQLDRRMPVEQLAAMVRHFEGWPVGLRLAFRARGGPVPERAAEAYLLDEVLAVQPPADQRFLLRTSVPDRICGALAEVLTGQRDGQRMLEQLAAANLFIEPVGTGQWFRYHRAFRSALRHRLQSSEPDVVPQLHLLAARWHAAEGDVLVALTHAAAAGSWQLLAELVVRRGLTLFASADRTDFVKLLERIPPERLSDSAELCLCGALLAYGLGNLRGMSRPLEAARTARGAAGRDPVEGIDVAIGLTESSSLMRWQGDMPRLAEVSSQLIADIATVNDDDGVALVQYRTQALFNKAAAVLWLGRLDHADRYLWAAASSARSAGLPLVAVAALGHLALLAFFRGSVSESEEHATAAMDIARCIDAGSRPGSTPARLARALIESERGRDIEADEELRRALQSGGDNPEAALAVVAALVRARLLIDRGDGLGARAALRQAWDDVGPGLVSPLLTRLTALAESDVDLASGEPAAVVARYAGRGQLWSSEQLLLARAYLADPRTTKADSLLGVARAGSDRISAVNAWVLIALTEDARGHGGQAGEALQRALTLAEPEQIRRPFRHLDAPRVLALAERRQWLTNPHDPAGENVLAEITGELPTVAPLALPLSERELEVLQYLPTMLTAGEIAESLNISVNTVKAHMRSIYRKLGAGRRREAVVISRQLGLL
jgi:LuxR family maltose regulon positive regulatory protein